MNPGDMLGPYRVLEKLGEGGMGEVYKARDTRLDRTVAIKVLPTDVSADPERRARFEREAKTIAGLNHPHVCTLYDVGEHEGAMFLVMEHLAGQTLADRLEKGPLPLEQALTVAAEIADALSAAHRQGVIHRDLKPGNVMLTKGGAKLLDFGLARLTRASDGSGASVTLSAVGTVVGTVPYMAPEQVEGRLTDARTDLFAFGTVLYEMLTGRRAFEGESQASVMAAILEHDPPPISAHEPLTPPTLDRLVRQCLAKSPEDRFQDARDLAFALEVVSGAGAAPAAVITTPHPVWRSPWAVAALWLVVGVVAGWLAFSRLRTETSVPTYSQLTFRRGTISAARFAPDGQTVVYSAAWEGGPTEVYASRIGSPEARRLGLEGQLLALSRSGDLLVLRGTALSRASLAGGAPRQILDDAVDAAWDREGRELAVVRRAGGRLRVEYPIGKPLYDVAGTNVLGLRFLPEGSLAFFESSFPLPAALRLVSPAGDSRPLTQSFAGWYGLAWHPATREIWFAATRKGEEDSPLCAVDLSGHERVVARIPGDFWLQDVDERNRLLMKAVYSHFTMVVSAPADAREREVSWFDWSWLADLSPDASRVLFTETSGTRTGVYVRRTDGSDAVRLGDGFALALSPDGRWALARSGSGDSVLLHPTGPGEPRRLQSNAILKVFNGGSWLPDGRSVVVIGGESASRARLFVWNIDGGAPRPISPEGVYDAARASPDGRWVAAGGGAGPTLFPVSGGEPRPVPGRGDGETVAGWSADSRSLFVWSPGGRTATIDRLDINSGQREPWKVLTPTNSTGIRKISYVTVNRDGRGYAYSYLSSFDRLYLVEGLR
jgi:eukaryotic-like serine/threonine-protein kinase